MSNNIRQEHFTTAISQLEARLAALHQASAFEQVRGTPGKVGQMEYVASELQALSHGAALLSDRLAEWAAELLDEHRS
jgi:hypothetical protein